MIRTLYFVALLLIILLCLASAVAGLILNNQSMLIGGSAFLLVFVFVMIFVYHRFSRAPRSLPIETKNPVPDSSTMKRNKSDTDLQLIQPEIAV